MKRLKSWYRKMRYRLNDTLEVQDYMFLQNSEYFYATIALSYLSLDKDINLNPNNKLL